MNKDAIEAAIHSYIRAWNAQDFAAMAAHFTEPAVFILASGTRTLATRAELVAFLRGVFESLNAAGFGHTEIGAIEVWQCADGLWTVEVQYTLRRDADGAVRLISALWCQHRWRQRKLGSA
jgi:uncharacterized protein (TIGR02246 family)